MSKETLRSYLNRYWELYNKIGGDNEHVVANTFKLGLPIHFELRDSLTMQPSKNMHQLMRRIEEHKRLEDDRLQNKVSFSTRRNPRLGTFNKGPEGRLGDRTPLAKGNEWTLLSKSLCIKSWRRLSISFISANLIKWEKIQLEGNRICTALIIEKRGILPSNAEHSRITWNSWSKPGIWGSIWSVKGAILQDRCQEVEEEQCHLPST